MNKVIMTNLNGDVVICSEEEAKQIQEKQMVEILNNGFTQQSPYDNE